MNVQFAKFMAGPIGRTIRFGIGIAVIAIGLMLHSVVGTIVAVLGLIPLAAGIFDWCPSALLFGLPLRARDILRR